MIFQDSCDFQNQINNNSSCCQIELYHLLDNTELFSDCLNKIINLEPESN